MMAADAALLKMTLPAFAAVADATIAYWLTEAGSAVTWENGDRAQMLLAAHYMTLNGIGGDDSISGARLAGVSSLRTGSLSVTFESGAAGAGGSLSSTSYGRQFADIASRFRAGPLVTGTGCVDASALDPRIPRWPL